MKAYINKGTKIKWENTPAAPEFTDDRIKHVIDANVPPIEVTTPENGDILSYDSTSEKWVNTEPPAGNLEGLTDVDITTPANGDILSYDGTSEKWVNTTPEQIPSWHYLRTITTDGTESRYQIDRPEGVSNIKGVFINFDIKAHVSETGHLRGGIRFGSSDFRMWYIGNAITTSEKWGKAYIFKDSDLWLADSFSAPTSSSNVTISRTNDGWNITDGDISGIYIESTVNTLLIPEGSTIEIYLKY